jgi:hypothetical protein
MRLDKWFIGQILAFTRDDNLLRSPWFEFSLMAHT